MLDDQPTLRPHEEPFFKGFTELSRSRQRAEIFQPIQISEVYYYCKLVFQPDIEEFLHVIKELDKFFLNWAEDHKR